MDDRQQSRRTDYQNANTNQVEAINEVIASAAEVLPEGYAVTKIDPESGFYEAEYNPEMAGRRIGESDEGSSG